MGGRNAVVEVGGEDAVLHHVCLLAGDAFVVEVDGAAVAGNGAVVDYVYAGRADFLPHLSGKDGCALAVEIGLKGMSHGLVEEDSGGAGSHHHAHAAAFGTARLKTGVNPFHGFFGQFLCKGRGEHFCAASETPGHGFVLQYAVLLKDRAYGDAAHGPGLVFQFPGRIVHEDVADGERQVHYHLADAGVAAADVFVQGLQEGEETVHGHLPPVVLHGIAVCGRVGLSAAGVAGSVWVHLRGTVGNLGGGTGAGHYVGLQGAFGVCIAGFFSGKHTHSYAEVYVAASGSYGAVTEKERAVASILEIEVRVASSSGKTFGHNGIQHGKANPECV